MRTMSPQLKQAFDAALQQASHCRAIGDAQQEFRSLERAHVLGQNWLLPHWRVHLLMLEFGVRHGRWREVIGQLWRILLTPLGHLSGRLPVGNTGGANISAFARLPLDEDIRRLLDGNTSGS